MLILALDTSGDICSVAIADDSALRAEYRFRHERRLTERLPGIVDFLLRDVGASLKQVEAFAVGLGPGSFTGVRVGVTMAKLWAVSLERPLIGISSLDALVEPLTGALAPDRILAAVAPTRRTEVVAGYYRGELTSIAPPAVTANADVATAARAAVGAAADAPVVVCGEAAELVWNAAPSATVHVYGESVSAGAVARLAAARLAAGDTDDADTLVPLYVTPSPVG